MLSEERQKTKKSASELRKFGVTMAAVLALLGGLFLWRHGDYYWFFFAPSMVLLSLALFLPFILKPAHTFWTVLSVTMGWFLSRVILIILFYLILTPTALLIRILGKDNLRIRRPRNSSDSYWLQREISTFQKTDYEKQF